jgi:hypothetical protein
VSSKQSFPTTLVTPHVLCSPAQPGARRRILLCASRATMNLTGSSRLGRPHDFRRPRLRPTAAARCWKDLRVRSLQTLSLADRRTVAAWAADGAERVLGVFENAAPGDDRPRELIARARAFARGELAVADGIRRRFDGGVPAREVRVPAAAAAARAAGQAAATPHMGAHALGAAAYAAMAAGLAAPNWADAVAEEVRWQLDHMSAAVSAALRLVPPAGENLAGPLGPGLLTSGRLGAIIHDLQAGLAGSDRVPQ